MSLAPPPTPSGRLMIIATLSVKPGKEQLIQDLLKDAQKRANSNEEPDTLPPLSSCPGDYQDSPSISHTLSHSALIHLRTSPRQYHLPFDTMSTTPTTQYHTVPHSYLTSLRLRDLLGPPRNPLKGHHFVVPATTRSFPSSVAVPVAPFELQPAPSTLQHKLSYTNPYHKTHSDPGLTLCSHFIIECSEEYGVNGLEVHMAGPPLQALMEAFKDSDVLDGELVIDYLDEI
ncbi:hypothetical protein F5879DRAFT_1026518 [Lentinula edodes]|nr:hypothetical protein F5879DRAFT_1026518 [Lentinula edodes]